MVNKPVDFDLVKRKASKSLLAIIAFAFKT